MGSDYITTLAAPYIEPTRTSSAGTRRINSSLRLHESIYSLAYVYLLKGIHIEGDLSDDEEREALDRELDNDNDGK